jgi:hypothetical protein
MDAALCSYKKKQLQGAYNKTEQYGLRLETEAEAANYYYLHPSPLFPL